MLTLPPVSAVLQNMGLHRDRRQDLSNRRDTHEERPLTLRLRNGRTVTLYGSVRTSLNDVLLHKIYDVPGVAFRQCRQVFDLGADIGVFGVYVASQAPATAITCVEASCVGFPLLQRNLTVNTDRAHAYRMVVAAKCGERRSSIARDRNGHRPADKTGTIQCITLAQLFTMTGAETCDFLRMDVGGEELSILLETPIDILRRVRVMSMRWNYAEEELPRVRLRLAAAGFETIVDYVGYRRSQIMLKARQR